MNAIMAAAWRCWAGICVDARADVSAIKLKDEGDMKK